MRLTPLAQYGSLASHQAAILLLPPNAASSRSWALLRGNSPLRVAVPRSQDWPTTWPGSPKLAMATTWLLIAVLTGVTVPPTSEFPAMTSMETSAPWEYPSRTSFWFGQLFTAVVSSCSALVTPWLSLLV